jgi:hypothetical protein
MLPCDGGWWNLMYWRQGVRLPRSIQCEIVPGINYHSFEGSGAGRKVHPENL